MISDLKNINMGESQIKSFGILFGTILIIVYLVIYYKLSISYNSILIIGLLFILSSFFFIQILKPIYIIWMVFGSILGWIMTRMILLALFFGIISPISILLKCFRFNYLDFNIDENKKTYWEKITRSHNPKQDLENQF